MMHCQDTICAIATAPGGAIGIVRVSGADALATADKIFFPKRSSSVPLREQKAYTVSYGEVRSPDGEVLDDVLVSIFRAPHSYTGEDAVEFSCHGSSYILQRLIQLLVENGCRMARPGEYTQRAFLNGKMDLTEAEAVADLISSDSAASHKIAMKQMRGRVRGRLDELRERLLHLTSMLELELDFSEHEELEFADRTELTAISEEIFKMLTALQTSFKTGRAIKEGAPVAIIGETNAGKSTLLNALVGEEKAIVSDIHGTTRDVIEDVVTIDGIKFRFMDTAGLRDTSDEIEQIGIRKSMEKAESAETLILLVDACDADAQIPGLLSRAGSACTGKNALLVINKTDLIDGDEKERISQHIASNSFLREKPIPLLFISAKRGDGMKDLKDFLVMPYRDAVSDESVVISNLRHYDAITRACDAILRVKDGLAGGLPSDLLSLDLHDCLDNLAEITGDAISNDEVLGNIFKHFCIGK